MCISVCWKRFLRLGLFTLASLFVSGIIVSLVRKLIIFLLYRPVFPIAVVEAKDEAHSTRSCTEIHQPQVKAWLLNNFRMLILEG